MSPLPTSSASAAATLRLTVSASGSIKGSICTRFPSIIGCGVRKAPAIAQCERAPGSGGRSRSSWCTAFRCPRGKFGTEMVAAFFTNTLDTTRRPVARGSRRAYGYRATCLISRRGRFVASSWHLIVALGMRACRVTGVVNGATTIRSGLNSIGTDDRPYTTSQYDSPRRRARRTYAPLSASVAWQTWSATAEIAPGRKTDPGPAFDWPSACSGRFGAVSRGSANRHRSRRHKDRSRSPR